MNDPRSAIRLFRRAFLITFAVGAVLLIVFYGSQVTHIGSLGQGADIGGGLIALAGYVLAGIGVIGLLVTAVVSLVNANR
ncbi:hypothetical protein BJY18_001450 [Amycolatopsis jiangsuensis]|uniref:Uncharacterized protein n=1 Tax=Amycolatopsis jiangsuensis TaxID=1181879 RepID=A0A840IR92_9PSEU|nr:hypothetical protein [Amycolatopsis jiangsuensis]